MWVTRAKMSRILRREGRREARKRGWYTFVMNTEEGMAWWKKINEGFLHDSETEWHYWQTRRSGEEKSFVKAEGHALSLGHDRFDLTMRHLSGSSVGRVTGHVEKTQEKDDTETHIWESMRQKPCSNFPEAECKSPTIRQVRRPQVFISKSQCLLLGHGRCSAPVLP